MVINGEVYNALGAGVNDSQKMSLSGLETELRETSESRALMWLRVKRQQAAVVVHLAVDQSVVGFDDLLVGTNVLLSKAVVILMVPIADHDGANIDIVISARRTVDDHWTESTTSVLSRVMRVVPARAVQISGESICEVVSRSNRALLDTRNTVVVRSIFLEKPVPVKSGTLLVDGNTVFVGSGYSVVDSDGDGVSPVGFNERPRKLIIDQQHGAVDAVRA